MLSWHTHKANINFQWLYAHLSSLEWPGWRAFRVLNLDMATGSCDLVSFCRNVNYFTVLWYVLTYWGFDKTTNVFMFIQSNIKSNILPEIRTLPLVWLDAFVLHATFISVHISAIRMPVDFCIAFNVNLHPPKSVFAFLTLFPGLVKYLFHMAYDSIEDKLAALSFWQIRLERT